MRSLLVGSMSGRCLVFHPPPSRLLLGDRIVPIIHPLSLEGTAIPEPGILILGTFGFLASVLGPLDVRVLPQDSGVGKRPDIHPDTVEVGIPADRLLGERLPADEYVVRRLAGKDELEPLLESLSVGQSQVGSRLATPGVGGLEVNPILDVPVGQAFQPAV
jgi:hypothetical protein